jgi:hypothetical protein
MYIYHKQSITCSYPISNSLRQPLNVRYSPRSHQFPVAILQHLPCWTVLSVGLVSALSVSTLGAVALVALAPHKFVHQSCWHHWLACEIKNCDVTIASIPVSGSRSSVLNVYWVDITCWWLVVSLQLTKNDQMANLRHIMSEFPSFCVCTVNMVTCHILLCSDCINCLDRKIRLNHIYTSSPYRAVNTLRLRYTNQPVKVV